MFVLEISLAYQAGKLLPEDLTELQGNLRNGFFEERGNSK
jgi:hypothetical protein